jgi:hypothetical protein
MKDRSGTQEHTQLNYRFSQLIWAGTLDFRRSSEPLDSHTLPTSLERANEQKISSGILRK